MRTVYLMPARALQLHVMIKLLVQNTVIPNVAIISTLRNLTLVTCALYALILIN